MTWNGSESASEEFSSTYEEGESPMRFVLGMYPVYARVGAYKGDPLYENASTGIQIWRNHNQWRIGNVWMMFRW